MSQKWLLNRLRQETGELSRAIKRGNATEIAREAADVSNFAMMIADNALEEEQREAT
jgi:NTP pyrophosphatase (non-canonical NTP hydrolase)